MLSKGQSMIELVVGLGLITIIVGALAVVTINSLRNTQFSKNQAQATKFAQENLEKVRTIKNSNFGVCMQQDAVNSCSTWDDIWAFQFGSVSTTCTSCNFILQDSCTLKTGEVKPFCLKYSTTKRDLGNGFTSEVILEDEAPSQKKVTTRVYWTDTAGLHSSDLVTILSKY